jgi:hypothetical protein
MFLVRAHSGHNKLCLTFAQKWGVDPAVIAFVVAANFRSGDKCEINLCCLYGGETATHTISRVQLKVEPMLILLTRSQYLFSDWSSRGKRK